MEIVIQQIRLDSDGRLRLQPVFARPTDYKYIWRDATNVAWDEACGELYARDVLTPLEQFNRIVRAVAREYGDRLTFTSATAFVDLPGDLIAVLRKSGV